MSDGTRDLPPPSVAMLFRWYERTNPTDREDIVVEVERRIQAAWDAGHAAGLAHAVSEMRRNIGEMHCSKDQRFIDRLTDRLSPEPPKGEER